MTGVTVSSNLITSGKGVTTMEALMEALKNPEVKPFIKPVQETVSKK
ncbi:hypothetical protein [Leptotrichia sp. oral taxon 212]|nr:hypothetical protein [Leptotrichia sp. oral taxon 212]